MSQLFDPARLRAAAQSVSPEDYNVLTRVDFNVFIERVFLELNGSTPYCENFHIGVIAAKLEAVRRGEITRLIINVPPRSLKSIIASVAFPAFVMGHNPAAKIIAVSYGQELADEHARDCRQVMQQAWYEALFHNTRLSAERKAVHGFETTAGGHRIATSVGGVLTGLGGDLIIIDDPVKPDQAMSETERKAANHWYSHTLQSRLNDKTTGAIVVVMQRLHEDDFVGHILGLADWEVVTFPAIAPADQECIVETPHGYYVRRIHEGDALQPEREPLSVLADLQRSLGTVHFSAQYLQAPAPPGGSMIHLDWFPRYVQGEVPKFERVVQSWDTAVKDKELNDYSVCTTWGQVGKHFWLLDVLRKRLELSGLLKLVPEHARLHGAQTIIVEDAMSGTSLYQLLKGAGIGLTPYRPKGNKVMRLNAQTAVMEAGHVHLPSAAHWLETYLHELTHFPKSAHDDQVDSTAQALDWLSEVNVKGAAYLEIARQWNRANGFSPEPPEDLPPPDPAYVRGTPEWRFRRFKFVDQIITDELEELRRVHAERNDGTEFICPNTHIRGYQAWAVYSEEVFRRPIVTANF
jgi:predicted phage terminase large subunit-like protein